MKKQFIKHISSILLFTLIFSGDLSAQCGNNEALGISPDPVTSDYTGQSINIRIDFILIRRDDGSGDIQSSILSGIMHELDDTYGTPHNIYFTQGCVRYIDSTRWYSDGLILAGQLNDLADSLASPDAITVFIQKNDADGLTGQAGTDPNSPYQPYSWFKYNGQVLIASHEIGHTLGLYHTDFAGFGKSCSSIAAHDTLRGDLVADTPIDPHESSYYTGCVWDTAKCGGSSFCKDSCGDYYLGVDPTIIMSESLDYSCTDHFTTGQANRMKRHVMNNLAGTFFDVVYDDVYISGKRTISTPTHFAKNIIIGNGDTLVVTSTVYMPSKGRIIIEAGGTLDINGGTITKGKILDVCNEREGNPKFWYGIEMQISNTGTIPRFLCDGGSIEFSEMGIHNPSNRNAGNAAISISNSVFRNNMHSIHLMRAASYSFPIPINTTRFYLDGEFPLGQEYHTQIKVDNSKMYIDSCLFDNPSIQVPINDATYCINAFNTNLGIKHSKFKDSLFGVRVESMLSPAIFGSELTSFKTMKIGVNTINVENFSITKDTFEASHTSGLISDNCSHFIINNNTFKNKSRADAVGIIIKNSKLESNTVEKNIFSDLYNGNVAVDNNGDIKNGLQYRCNGFESIISEEFRFDGTVNGIQGAANNAAGNAKISGNFIYFDLRQFGHNGLKYYTRNTFPEYPKDRYSNKISDEVTSSLNCQLTGKPNADTVTHYVAHKSKSDTMLVRNGTLNGLIDGGNTSALLTYITNANSGNAATLYTHLTNKSPWLSSGVMLAAYNRTDLWDSTQRTNLLYNNPYLFISKEFRESLSNADVPLPESSLNSLDTLTHYSSARTDLEAEIAMLKLEAHELCYDTLYTMKIDTSYQTDSILTWSERIGDYTSGRDIMEIHYSNGDFSEAEDALENLSERENLTTDQESDVSGLEDLVPYMINILEDDRYEGNLTEEEIEWLIDFAQNNDNKAGLEVRSTLRFYYDIDVDAIVSLKKFKDANGSIIGDNSSNAIKLNSVETVNIYPNPSKNELIIDHPFEESQLWHLEVLDLNGKILASKSVNTPKVRFDISKIPTGIFVLKLEDSLNNHLVKRIQIIK